MRFFLGYIAVVVLLVAAPRSKAEPHASVSGDEASEAHRPQGTLVSAADMLQACDRYEKAWLDKLKALPATHWPKPDTKSVGEVVVLLSHEGYHTRERARAALFDQMERNPYIQVLLRCGFDELKDDAQSVSTRAYLVRSQPGLPYCRSAIRANDVSFMKKVPCSEVKDAKFDVHLLADSEKLRKENFAGCVDSFVTFDGLKAESAQCRIIDKAGLGELSGKRLSLQGVHYVFRNALSTRDSLDSQLEQWFDLLDADPRSGDQALYSIWDGLFDQIRFGMPEKRDWEKAKFLQAILSKTRNSRYPVKESPQRTEDFGKYLLRLSLEEPARFEKIKTEFEYSLAQLSPEVRGRYAHQVLSRSDTNEKMRNYAVAEWSNTYPYHHSMTVKEAMHPLLLSELSNRSEDKIDAAFLHAFTSLGYPNQQVLSAVNKQFEKLKSESNARDAERAHLLLAELLATMGDTAADKAQALICEQIIEQNQDRDSLYYAAEIVRENPTNLKGLYPKLWKYLDAKSVPTTPFLGALMAIDSKQTVQALKARSATQPDWVRELYELREIYPKDTVDALALWSKDSETARQYFIEIMEPSNDEGVREMAYEALKADPELLQKSKRELQNILTQNKHDELSRRVLKDFFPKQRSSDDPLRDIFK